ncbi:serine/threonine-protein kinase [Amycolatopsis sp. PS_44_ISF1]|uniref:serine/threonine-protein kinase n=1 Tax=Amycolatopsis sp. PS_44_ISF1 TaxID=2974917 RepID=UPI0028DE9138|nr:serine/threonine-protein kinase [Amycolatopsis sp. PS_44_ISF1]MDT8914074.1 serine/threonine protein kinase [Amycolatopsis sp. PS_44_ISF1]
MIAGHYRLVEHIGSGAMGVVWRAVDVRLERSVAIKQILPQPGVSEAERDNMRQRAMREAKNAARLQHPNAIVVFDIAEHSGDPCLVMEYLDGPSLSAVLAEQGTLPVGQVARIGEQVAAALVAAHRAGIVHRDVKPGNILIDETGTAKITDFGISRAAGDMTLTQTGLIGGTPAYLAPELARGADPVPSSDVFALGATLYQAIEGQTPYGNTTNQLALLYAAANGQINPPTQAGPATALLMSLLRSEPAERPSMAEARERLAALTAGEPTPPMTPMLLSGNQGDRLGARPPWQRAEAQAAAPAPIPAQKAPSNPPRTPTAAFTPMRSPAAPPQNQPPPRPVTAVQPAPARPAPVRSPVPPRTPATTAAAPGSSDGKPADGKRKAALLAGGAAAVVVVAVVLFLVLNNGSGGDQGPATAVQPPPASTSAPASSSKAAPSSSAAPPTGSNGNVAWQPAGGRVVEFYSAAGSNPAAAWAMLTPGVQANYGDVGAFTAYWGQHKPESYKGASAYKRANNPDGSVDIQISLTVDGTNMQQIVRVLAAQDGTLLLSSDPRPGSSPGQ